MNFCRKNRGSISIMLCILLLPMITYASMIMDASRLQAAKTAISGAGDLAMNAAMSEYDKVVKDMYGLFSMVQNEADLDNALKDYFTKTIEGALKDTGTDDQTIQEYADSFANWIIDRQNDGEFDFDDFLSMQVDDMTIGNVSSSALANPAVMKRQIVEYMKYKGPVSLASTLISKLGFLKNSSEQTEVLEQKVEYATSLNTVQEACNAAYTAVEEYNVSAKDLNDSRKDQVSSYRMEETVIKARNYLAMAAYAELMEVCDPLYVAQMKAMISGTKVEVNTTPEKKDALESDSTRSATLSSKNAGELLSILNDYITKMSYIIDYTHDGDSGSYENLAGNIELKYDSDSPEKSSVWAYKMNNDQIFHQEDVRGYAEDIKDDLQYLNNINEGTDEQEISKKMSDLYELQNLLYVSDMFERYRHTLGAYDTKCKVFKDTFKEYEKRLKSDLAEENKNSQEIEEALKNNQDYQKMKTENSKVEILYKYFCDENNSDSIINMIEELERNCYETSGYRKASGVFIKKSVNTIKKFYNKIVDACTKLENVNVKLGAVIEKMATAEQEKEQWHDSIQKVDDGSTKTSMQSDFDTATDGISIDEVNALLEATSAIQTKLNELKKDFEEISFIDHKLLSSPPTPQDINSDFGGMFMSNTKYGQDVANANYIYRQAILVQYAYAYVYNQTGLFPFSCSNKLLNLPQNILQNDMNYLSMFGGDMTDEQKMQYLFIEQQMLNSMSFDDFVANGYLHGMAGYIDGYKDNPPTNGGGELYDKEKFYFTLKSIADPKKTKLKDEEGAKNKADKINETVKKGENLDKEESTDDKSDSGKKDDGKSDSKKGDDKKENSISVGDILKTVEAYCTTEDIPVAQGEDFDTDTSTAKGIKVSSTDKSGYQSGGESSSKSLGQAKSILSKLADLGATVVEYAYLEEYFTEMFSCDTDRVEVLDKQIKGNDGKGKLTLSGTTLKTDTEWYGKEVEYMLWGDADLSSNVTKNYAMIYLIRFALNAIYAFTAPDIQSFALEVATAIAGWTVVGVPIVQAVITVGLALAESGVDIAKLRQGKSIAIYKSQSTFICSPSGLTTAAIDAAVEYVADEVEQYVDDKIDEIADGLSGTIGDNIGPNGKLRIYAYNYAKEQTETMKTKVVDMFVTPLLNKLTPVLNEASNKSANLHSLINSAVDGALSSIKSNIDSQPGGMLKELEELAYNKFIDGTFKSDFIDTIDDFFTKVDNNLSPDSLQEKIVEKIDKIKDQIDEKVQEFSNKIFDKLMKEFEAKKDEAVGKAKDVVHDKVSEFSDELSGKISGAISDHVKDAIPSIDSGSSGGFTLDYKEYCKIFVFLNIAMNEQKMLKRCAALVGANVKNADKDHSNFDIEKAFTLVYVNADIKMNTLFPWGVENTFSDTTGDNSYGFNIGNMGSNSVKVHYDAMNGY